VEKGCDAAAQIGTRFGKSSDWTNLAVKSLSAGMSSMRARISSVAQRPSVVDAGNAERKQVMDKPKKPKGMKAFESLAVRLVRVPKAEVERAERKRKKRKPSK
jgi:hypothetical protein